jgi:hypothetical protein
MMLIVPSIAQLPYNAEDGPWTTSILSTRSRSRSRSLLIGAESAMFSDMLYPLIITI